MPRSKKADLDIPPPTEGMDRDEWPDVPLAWVFMFGDYLRYAAPLHRAHQGGASVRPTFRDYVDGDAPVGTHRFLVKIIDRLEDRLGRLFIAREYRPVNGNMTMVTTKSQIESLPSKPKRNGAPTVDGEAYEQFSLTVATMWEAMRSDLPGEVLLQEFKTARDQLEQSLEAQRKLHNPPMDQEVDPEALE